MSIYEFEGNRPSLPEDGHYFIAPNATVLGKVTLGRMSSVWFNAVIRGDNDPVVIGDESNIQDNCVLHTDPGFPLTIGNRVTVGHLAMLHGCTIGDGTLIGMGATVMNGTRVGRNCIIGAHALVGEGKEIPDNSMVLGAPGRVVKAVDGQGEVMLAKAAEAYVDKVRRYALNNGLSLIES